MWRSEDNIIELVSLSTVKWVLGIELGSLGCSVSTFTHWVISPALSKLLMCAGVHLSQQA